MDDEQSAVDVSKQRMFVSWVFVLCQCHFWDRLLRRVNEDRASASFIMRMHALRRSYHVEFMINAEQHSECMSFLI